MRFLAVHPGPLMYTKVFLRLEPLGLEMVAGAARQAGHDVKIIDLQVASHKDYFKLLKTWQPDAIGISGNYLANIPEIIDLAKATKALLPHSLCFVGGHSVSFTAHEVLEHAEGAVDAVLKGEGEVSVVRFLEAAQDGPGGFGDVPGIVTADGEGPQARFMPSLDDVMPARDLLPKRRKYFIGILDPCASIEFTRGCPWDCGFCSAWTFYGRSYRHVSPERAVEDMARIREPGIFIVDDVAFIQSKHGFAIGREMERRNIKKEFYLETRSDVLLRNKDVFRYWKTLGMKYMFLGIEAIDEEGLKAFHKRVSLDQNEEALEFARSLGVTVAVNIIADPDWDVRRFEIIRKWALSIPEIVNVSINTPYPGTESWLTDGRELATQDYRLFDIQHAVLPTALPLPVFYGELVKTQQILNRKHLGIAALRKTAGLVSRKLMHGQTNFFKMLWKFNSVYNPELLLADHRRPVNYEMRLPEQRVPADEIDRKSLYIHDASRKMRQIDGETERFVADS